MSRSGKKFTPILVLLVVFVVGSLAGVGGTVKYLDKKREERRAYWRAQNEKERELSGEERFLYRLKRDLELTDEQLAAIRADEVFIASFAEVKALNEVMRPQVRAAFEKRMEAMKAYFTADQLEKMKTLRQGEWGRGGPHSRSGRDGERERREESSAAK